MVPPLIQQGKAYRRRRNGLRRGSVLTVQDERDVDHSQASVPSMLGKSAEFVPLRRHIPNRLRNQWPSLSVQALVFASVAAIVIDFRWSVGLLALALGLAFGFRAALPRRRIGWLEVRRKRTDLICLGLLLVGVVLVAVATPGS
jgi:uncharacterized membrane protein